MKKIFAVLLAVVLVVFATVPAFAIKSPSGETKYDVVVNNNQGGTGSYTVESVEDNDHYIITADPKDGYEFSHWVIDGDYDIIEGSLTDITITIKPLSDVVITPYFEKDGETPGEGPKDDDSDKSPATGDVSTQVMVVIAMLSVALFGAVVVKRSTSK